MVKEIFGVFASYTSIHGFGRVAESKYLIQRLIWVFAILGSFGICMFQIYRLKIRFSEPWVMNAYSSGYYILVPMVTCHVLSSNHFSVLNKKNIEYNDELLKTNMRIVHSKQGFPGVAVCNLNPMKFSEVVKDPYLYQPVAKTFDFLNVDFASVDMSNSLQEPFYNYTTQYDYGDDIFRRAIQTFRIRMANLSLHDLQKKSMGFYGFVKRCRFKSAICHDGNFTTFRHPSHGLCYAFNSGGIFSEAPGPRTGLELILAVEQKEYVPLIAPSAGVNVFIYDNTFAPELILSNELILPVGHEINIGLSAKEHIRLPGPHKKCLEENKFPSVSSCIQVCQQNQILAECRCAIDHKYMSENSSDITICATNKDLLCIENIMAFNKSGEKCTGCKYPCRELSYERTVSMSSWTAINSRHLIAKLSMNDVSDFDFRTISDETLLLRIFFKSLSKEVIEEETAYTGENFVSDIGGQLGLWIGMSVLSFAEILELIFLITDMVKNRKSGRGVTPKLNNEIKALPTTGNQDG